MPVSSAFYSLLPARIRLLRHLHGMSQEQLAEALDTTFVSVSRWEHGTNKIGTYYLLRLAQVFDVPVTVFFPPLAEWHPASQTSVCASFAFSGTCNDPAMQGGIDTHYKAWYAASI